MKCRVKFLTSAAKFGYPEHEGDIGYDLYADEDVSLHKTDGIWQQMTLKELKESGTTVRKSVKTGVSIQFDTNMGYARIAPRSGLSLLGVDVYGGVVDSSYRGELMVIMENNSVFSWVEIKKGDKIAQLIFEQAHHPTLHYVTELEETSRGTGGFGSTDQSNASIKPKSEGTLNTGYDICTQNV